MKITCISDLHGETPPLPGGDLLILAGDYTGNNKILQWGTFFSWLEKQDYKQKVMIGGNHDGFLEQCTTSEEARTIHDDVDDGYEYLKDNLFEFEGLKIWGSPWTKKFFGQNQAAMSFALDEHEQMREKWELIPEGIDILITHSPPMGILDNATNIRCGCPELRKVVGRIAPKLHVFGHIHSRGGIYVKRDQTLYVNAAYMDQDYLSNNNIVNIEL